MGPMRRGLAEAWWSRVCHLPRQNLDRLYAALFMADCCRSEGRGEEALQTVQGVHDVLVHECGEEHPNTLMSLHCLAHHLARTGRYAEAEQTGRKVLRARRQSLGDEHPYVLDSAEDVARFVAAQQKPEEARQILLEVLAARLRKFGAEHRTTLWCTHQLARTISDVGDHAEAEKMMRTVHRVQMRLLGPSHPDTLLSETTLAQILPLQAQKSRLVIQTQPRQPRQARGLDEIYRFASDGASVVSSQNKESLTR